MRSKSCTCTGSIRKFQERVKIEMSTGIPNMSDFDSVRLKDTCYTGIFEEAGEIAGIRKRQCRAFPKDLERLDPERLKEEIGDLLWYIAAVCNIEGFDLEEILEGNKEKLDERYNKPSTTL